jgi:hypothetical protein
MGINTTVLNGIRQNADDYGIDFERFKKIEKFLTNPYGFRSRQNKAIEIVKSIMTAHGKKELMPPVVQLAEVEYGIREIDQQVRDHVVHALLSFLLGVFINERFLGPSGQTVDPFPWKLAGLFHDVGYPVQIANNLSERLADQLNKIKRDLSDSRPDVHFHVVPAGINELSNDINSLDLIQERLDSWGLKINSKDEYIKTINSNSICHGIISSLSVLYIIDMMYQKYNPRRTYEDIYYPPGINWNQSCFENYVVPACAAIFVHNLPERCFGSAKLDRNRATLPYLLRLSDCLQDWEKPSANNPTGFPDSHFDIYTTSGRLVFRVTDSDRRDRIEQEIASTILDQDIEVC